MDRLTKINPDDNFSIAMNFAFAEGRKVILRHTGEEENAELCTFISKQAKKHGCEITAEEVEGGFCFECMECPMAVMLTVATQAAELRHRLMLIEDILGDTYDLKHLRKLMDADREKRLHMFPCKRGDKIYALRKTWASSVTGKIIKGRVYGMELGRKGNWVIWYTPDGEPKTNGYALYPKDYQKTWFLSQEEAEAALAARKEKHE